MTALEQVRAELVAATGVTALVGTRIYPSVAPQGVTCPFVVLTMVSDVPEVSFDNLPADQLRNSRIQVDAYALTYRSAHQVAEQVDRVLGSIARTDLSITREGTQDLYDDEAQLHRASADFSVWSGPYAGVDVAASTITLSPSSAAAGTAIAVAIHVVDTDGAPVVGATCVVSVGGSAPAQVATAITQPSVTDANGDCSASVTSTYAESGRAVAVVVTAPGASFATLSSSPTVAWVAAAPSPHTSTVSIAPTSIPRNGITACIVTVQCRDAYSNVCGAGVTGVTIVVAGVGPTDYNYSQPGATNGSGQAIGSFTANSGSFPGQHAVRGHTAGLDTDSSQNVTLI